MFLQLLLKPRLFFEKIAQDGPGAINKVLPFTLLIVLLPPAFSWIGASNFGWRLGGSEPLFLDPTGEIVFSLFYFIMLCIGFFGTVLASRWMADTYGASDSFALHCVFFTIVCAPLAIASAAHLFPDVLFNFFILLPAFLWSITLLFKGLPIAFEIAPERGILMASALIGWLMVAAVSLLGLCTALWVKGAGSIFGV